MSRDLPYSDLIYDRALPQEPPHIRSSKIGALPRPGLSSIPALRRP